MKIKHLHHTQASDQQDNPILHTASSCVENSTIALPFFFFDTNKAVTSPYCGQQPHVMLVLHNY